jgi:outer membrane lipoprotein LolB
MRVTLAVVVAAAQLAVGCATPPLAPGERRYAGRFAVVVSIDGKRDTGSGRFALAVGPAAVMLELASPVGTTLARVESGPHGARLTTPGGADGPQEVRGADAEVLTYSVLGWPLPVAGFGDWIAGRPAPERPARSVDNAGVESFEQDGWTVAILERFDAGRGAPRRLQMQRPEKPGTSPSIDLRLVLDEPG